MPMIFSPGEPETRPLDPSAVFYTTAQKVADLLDIGPQEEVLASATADVNAYYITGADFRNHGFEAGDKVKIYSDADPFGHKDVEVLSVAASVAGDSAGKGHVKITFTTSPIVLTADYDVADNAYIQNQASFSNGKTRGVTKAKVEDHILRMQDRIDNLTHNAWRPYVVAAEYINFDTYKPYRRRYYTDYVGTSPLLYRNIQQVLRLELWQGNDYREIGAAEAHIKIADISELTGKTLYFCPGNNSMASLVVGNTATTEWRNDFDETTTAQNLADLINKEDRVGKTAVTFVPNFTLEGSTANVGIHNEFFASANADYGTGVIKITSLRAVKAGETCTIAFNGASGLEIDQIESVEGNSASVAGDVVTVGYIYKNGVVTTDASDTAGFADAGLLKVGIDILRYTGKTPTVIDANGVVTSWGTFTGCVNVSGTPLTTLNTIGTAFLQNRFSVDLQGGSGSGDSGRLRDWWIDYEMGIIYFNNSYPFFEWNAIKVSYIYGERYLEKAIEDMCTKMVAIELLLSDDHSILLPEGTQNIDLTSKVQLYKADIERVLPRYIEVVNFA